MLFSVGVFEEEVVNLQGNYDFLIVEISGADLPGAFHSFLEPILSPFVPQIGKDDSHYVYIDAINNSFFLILNHFIIFITD